MCPGHVCNSAEHFDRYGEPVTTLQVHDVTHRYGQRGRTVTALDRVSLDVDAGELTAVLGPSGSGKSTLLSIAGGLLHPTEGTVTVAGTPLNELRRSQLQELRARQIGFVFQTHNLVPYLTVRENLEVIGVLLAGNRGPTTVRDRSLELLGELGLADRLGHLPAHLSAGESQRVAIARALLNEPYVLLVDEPTASLDTTLGAEVVKLLVDQAHDRGVAVVVVTHDHAMADLADRRVHLRDGRVIRSDPRPDPPDGGNER